MVKLNPPIIEGTIPAAYGNEIKIPFVMNKSVSKDEISGFALKIKGIRNNILANEEYKATINKCKWLSPTMGEITFSGIEGKLNIGQFYKV